ncbi:MAG: MFS transporter [Clostridia bacterium]|nr:MFS transporter [Clostridia bacterium]
MKREKKLIFFCWLIYFTAYLGRYSYNSNINYFMSWYGVNHASAGTVTTFFFFAYGVGQIVHGLLCKHYPRRYVLSGALLVSAICNLSLFFPIPFAIIKYLWMVNGIVQSMLWPTLIYLLGKNLCQQNIKRAVVTMSTTIGGGTLVIYGVSALLSLFDGFRFCFLFSAIALTAVSVVSFFRYPLLVTDHREDLVEEEEAKQGRLPLKAGFIITVVIMCVFAVVDNLVGEGLRSWVPSILKEKYSLPNGISILLTLCLPVLGFFGTALVVSLRKHFQSVISLCGVLFAFATLCMLAVVALMNTSHWVLTLCCMSLISCMMSGVNNVVTSMMPLTMRDKMNPGLLTGILNGSCYVGSTISSFGLGWIADLFDWNGVFTLLLVACAVPFVISIIVSTVGAVRRRGEKKTAE